jgi:thiol:disulfide interchange protein DsbA
MKSVAWVLAAVLIWAGAAFPAHAASARWVEGTHYVALDPAQPTSVPAGKIEVLEVFSYACPACNGFQPVIHQLERGLPKNARMVFLPASFIPSEDWPMFQRAYFAAESLGIAQRTHQAIFDAVWKTGELATVEPGTNRLKQPAPSIEDAARCYAQLTGVSPGTFLAAARSFGVETRMHEADDQIRAMQVFSTPTIVVDGKYRILMESLKSPADVIGLVKYLVAKAGAH